MNDAREGHTAQDMGLRAKQLKSASRVLANAIAYNNACMVVTNHTYDQPGNNPSMPPTEVFSGGEGFNYICSTILNLKKYVKKEENHPVREYYDRGDDTSMATATITFHCASHCVQANLKN
jgi:RecA/RadA recombinase